MAEYVYVRHKNVKSSKTINDFDLWNGNYSKYSLIKDQPINLKWFNISISNLKMTK